MIQFTEVLFLGASNGATVGNYIHDSTDNIILRVRVLRFRINNNNIFRIF